METPEGIGSLAIGGNHYCLLPHPALILPPQRVAELSELRDTLLPLTVITWTKLDFTNHDIDTISESFSAEDDVWCRTFLSGKQASWSQLW
jgi:hypothetical protein